MGRLRHRSHGAFAKRTMALAAAVLVVALAAVTRAPAQGPTYQHIQFAITTGGDDLRGDSTATATLFGADGAPFQTITLKAQNQGGWGNNSVHTVDSALGRSLPLSGIARIVITLQSHNGFAESDDNWNVQGVVVRLSQNGANAVEWVSKAGDPLARLTGSQPSVTLTPAVQGPAGTFDEIRFAIVTGSDDLRGDSSATATLLSPTGAILQVVTLKAQSDGGWSNGSSRTVTATLNPPLTPQAISHVAIRLTSHNSFTETDDNWNVESVTVSLSNNGSELHELFSFAGDPLARLTGSQPTLTLPEEATGPAGTFNQIQFVVRTGGDDLRGDSSATATLTSPNGTVLQTLSLKTKSQPGWGNGSTNTVTLPLQPVRTPCAIGHVTITLSSHNGFGETDDNWNVQSVGVSLSNNGVGATSLMSGSGEPLARLTGSLPSTVLDNPSCQANALGPQPGTGRLRGFVDLHTHPLSNLGFGGKLIYGGVDVGSLLPADPSCNHNVRATSMAQALGHDNSTHGGWGTDNPCGDYIRQQVIAQDQQMTPDANSPGGDARGAPDFVDWPKWNDITHQKMWVDWIRRSYLGQLRVIVALAVNNKTLGDMVAGPGDFATDDKSTADRQLTETKSFVARHADFMQVAYSPQDVDRIVRANKLAVVLGIEIDDIGNFNKVANPTNDAVTAEIARLYGEGVRYVFPIHVIDNPFGGTAIYEDLFNYSNEREAGHWWAPACAPGISHAFAPVGGALFTAGVLAKLGVVLNAPTYPACPNGQGQVNSRGLTTLGAFAIKQMMRTGMMIDIDHMSDLSQSGAIEIAQAADYPLNSGHSALRSAGGNERSMSADHYAAIGRLHGMAGIGSANVDAYGWADQYRRALVAMGGDAVAAFGTDTDGQAMNMPSRRGSTVRYDDAHPRSSLGTKFWDYNVDGVAHYGMLPDFIEDVRASPAPRGSGPAGWSGATLVDDNLMYGADYFVETWKLCVAKSAGVH